MSWTNNHKRQINPLHDSQFPSGSALRSHRHWFRLLLWDLCELSSLMDSALIAPLRFFVYGTPDVEFQPTLRRATHIIRPQKTKNEHREHRWLSWYPPRVRGSLTSCQLICSAPGSRSRVIEGILLRWSASKCVDRQLRVQTTSLQLNFLSER